MSVLLERNLRMHRHGIAQWWSALDKPILISMLFLGVCGIILAYSTSQSVASRTPNIEAFYFAERQLAFAILATILCFSISIATPREVRRGGVILFGLVLIMLLSVLFIGEVRNGSQRWLSIAGFSIQPSEFAKPALIAISAWMFSLRPGERQAPFLIAFASFVVTVLLIARQPDYSQAALTGLTWLVLFFLTGASLVWAVSAAILAIAGGAIAFAVSPYVADRVRILFDTQSSSGGEQLTIALSAIREGGLLGVGPGEGLRKVRLPDAHSDFGIAVIGEEFGFLGVAVILIAYTVIVARALFAATRVRDPFARLMIGGLASLIALQVTIHIGVSARLVPPTGMTLPLVSYGGSSLLAMGIVFGMLLALTRSDQEMHS